VARATYKLGTVERVVGIDSEDGYFLEGLVIEADRELPVVVWVHGVYGAFYAPPGLSVARELSRRGVTTVLGNNRGHNMGAWLRRRDGSVLRGGGAWERFSEVRHDLAAWVRFASDGARSVVLAGHSLGARKVAAYVAQVADPTVTGVVLLSPNAAAPADDDPHRERALQLIAEGKADALAVHEPGFAISAATYVERTDPALGISTAFSYPGGEPAIAQIRVPILIVLGELERPTWDDAADELSRLATSAAGSPAVETVVATRANHMYADAADVVAEAITEWLCKLPRVK